jgi:hypothetical protein
LEIASGQIGVYLLPVPREHTIESDAQIIEGIGRLQWGNDMEISFFGALHMIEKYRGQNLSYDDLMVLSGYGYRTCFFDGWCPSSPDATCGYDCGDDILKKLGYKYEYLFLEGMDTADENYNMKTCSWDELREQIKSSIDNGYPLLAIDLIQVPEWGIITGYQKNGEELFCRTYFDQTEGYEIAQKRPWVIIRIYGKENVDIAPLYDQSLQLAATLYEVPSYQKYTNGINATQTWIAHLQDEDYLLALKPQEFAETAHANTWIYYALSDTRQKTAEYLVLHKADFSADPALFDRFCNIYRQEAEILQNGIKNVAAFDVIKTPQTWTQPMRSQQILTLQQYLNLEMQAQQLLNTMTKVDKLKK